MKKIILLLGSILLLGGAYGYVNPTLLDKSFKEAKNVDLAIETIQNDLPILSAQVPQVWSQYNLCKYLYQYCIEESRKKAKDLEAMIGEMTLKLHSLKEEQIIVWGKYLECSKGKGQCGIEPKPVDSYSGVYLPYRPDKSKYASYAYKISGGNKAFVLTLNAENTWRNHKMQSKVPTYGGPNGYEDAWGFCQINNNFSSTVNGRRVYHRTITSDTRFWSDPYRQLDWCWQLRKERYITRTGGATMYGYGARGAHAYMVKFNY